MKRAVLVHTVLERVRDDVGEDLDHGVEFRIEQFDGLRVLHRFTVELLMVYFPFSRLMHAFMFIPSRAFSGAWFGRRGVRA